MSIGTFLKVAWATSTGTGPPPAFFPLPLPFPFPPSPTSVGADPHPASRRAATRIPSSFDGCKKVDITRVSSVYCPPNNLVSAIRQGRLEVAASLVQPRLPECRQTRYVNFRPLPFDNTTDKWCI